MEGIYLIHTREFFRLKEPIYKIGRSYAINNRIKQYPNGSQVLFCMKCKNSKDIEKYLINLFKTKFIQKTYYGTEYFEGDEDEMINEISKYLYKCNTANKNNVDTESTESTESNENNKSDKTKKNNKYNETNESKHNIKNNTKDINKDRICPNCNYECKFPSLLKIHFRNSYHCLLSEEDIDIYFNKNINIDKCNRCNKNFKNRQALLRHNRETKCGKETKYSKDKNIIKSKK